MGCHTWFYVCLEERQKELREQYIKKYHQEIQSCLDFCKEQLEEDWQNEYNSYIITEDRKYWLKLTYPDCKKLPELSGVTDKNIKDNISLAKTNNWKEYKDWFINHYKYELKNNDLKEHLGMSFYGLVFKEDKIYIDACSEAADKYLSRKMHDLFRIHNYEAKNCYSLEDCIQRCKENNVILTDQQLKELRDWYNEYPNTIIEFG